jgi:glycosyltransferase involved in cell wall biosynthesis
LKFSVIICVYNGEDTLFRCLDAVKAIDYPAEDYEIVLVDNGSTDRTFRIAANYDIRLVGTRKNVRFSEAMKTGVGYSKYDNFLFVDQRTVVKKNILNELKSINYSPAISGELNIDKYRSNHDTFLYLINSKLYNPHFPQKNFGKELWITKKNYSKVHKNKAVLFIYRDHFIKLFEKGFDYNNGSDDLFRKIVFEEKGKILSHTGIEVDYISDLRVKTNRQIVENGFRWAKKGLSKFNLLSFLYYMIHVSILVIIALYPAKSLGILALIYLVFLIYLSKNRKDFWIVLRVAPGAILRFYSGTIKFLTSKK